MQGPFLRKYGTQTTINFQLYDTDGVDFKVDAADGGSDCSIMKDEGAEATCTNDFTDEGTGYSLVLTATEMQAARIVVYIIDAATKAYLDEAIVIETYGNASAQHAIDLDDSVRAGLTALPNAAADAAGGLPISDAGQLDLDTILGRITANVALASVCTEARLAELDAANLPADIDNILTDTGTTLDNHLTDIKGTGFVKDTHSLVDIEAYVDILDTMYSQNTDILADTNELQTLLTDGGAGGDLYNKITANNVVCSNMPDSGALTTIDANIDAILLDTGTTLNTHLTDIKGATFNGATDSLEAIRNRGDSAWTGSSTAVLNLLRILLNK